MITSIIAVLCHVATQPVCREEIVTEADIGIGLGCLIAEGQTIKDWKEHSIYRGDAWQITSVRCAPGGKYVPKDSA